MRKILILVAVIGLLTACGQPRERTPRKQATQVINHSDKDIIIETLHQGGYFDNGVYKITVDTSEYILVRNYDGLVIAKHN